METRQFGQTDMQVSILGFGGSEIRGHSLADIVQLLGSALDNGLNVIDTAECYGDSEDLIGRAVAARRDEYYLFTKCGHAVGSGVFDTLQTTVNIADQQGIDFTLPMAIERQMGIIAKRPIANAAWL